MNIFLLVKGNVTRELSVYPNSFLLKVSITLIVELSASLNKSCMDLTALPPVLNVTLHALSALTIPSFR